MTESYNHGLSELGQRMQSMSEPVDGVRLRPYQGGSQPSGSAVVERPAPAPAPASSPSWLNSYTAVPAPPEPYHDPVPQTTHANGNGSSHGAGYAPAPAAPKAAPAAAAPGQQPALPSSTASSEDPNAPKTGLQRAISAIRSTLPLVQRLLPLIDGNFATVLSSLVLPQSAQHHPAPPAPVVQVDLEPVERGLAEVRASHQELHNQVQEQTATIKRVEDQLEHVREATDRNTLEQQELVEDLRAVGGRISTFAIIGLVLLTISLGLNVYLLIQLQHILR